VNLNLEGLVEAKKAEERYHIYGMEHASSTPTSPLVGIHSSAAHAPFHRLDFRIFRFVVVMVEVRYDLLQRC
jgi:hypothetical protein